MRLSHETNDIVEVFAVVIAGTAPKRRSRQGAEARPGSENMARAHRGSLGTWEIRRRPCLDNGAQGRLVNKAQSGEGLNPHRRRSQEQAGFKTRYGEQFAETKSESKALGSLSSLIVPI